MADTVPFQVSTKNNRISATGDLRTGQMRNLFATMHNLTEMRGYRDIELDFSGLSAAFPAPVLALASQCQLYLKKGIDSYLVLPEKEILRRLFLNANWAYLIDPQGQPPSTFRGHTQIPARKYLNGEEQHSAVQEILTKILGILSDFDRAHLSALEWSVNEITDNVLNHAESEIGGLVQVTSFSRNRKAVEFAVCDAGVGIPDTLRSGYPDIDSDVDALDRAIREGVTRGKWVGQGNGLYGSYRIAEFSGGSFEIHSGYASMFYTPKMGFRVRPHDIPFNGTLVAATISYENPLVLEKALNFGGKGHEPVDFVELNYETDAQGNAQFVLRAESNGFGSRAAGLPVRNKLINLLNHVDGKISIDFGDVPLVSSSYADEVFGKLFVYVGPIDFANRFEFVRIDDMVKRLIDRSIGQRGQAGDN